MQKSTLTRRLALGLALAGGMVFAGAGMAQDAGDFPSKPVTLIVPFGAGGGSDTLARSLAGTAPTYLGQPLLVELQPGAGGVIATTSFARSAAPDGYTLIVTGTGATTTTPHSQEVAYDPINDFEFVIGVILATEVIAVRSDFPAETAEEFIQYIKDNPGAVRLGHSGTGGEDWALIKAMERGFESTIVDVPFDGAGPAATAAAGGHIDGSVGSLTSVTPFVESGALRIIAVANSEPSSKLPDVKTMPELGYPDVVLNSRLGIAAPKGTPQPVLQKLHDAFRATMDDESFKSLASRLNMNLSYLGLEDYRAALKAEYDRIGEAFKSLQQ
jgi:tripartite-type tricarboxylate transporter receptor subunit TctC